MEAHLSFMWFGTIFKKTKHRYKLRKQKQMKVLYIHIKTLLEDLKKAYPYGRYLIYLEGLLVVRVRVSVLG